MSKTKAAWKDRAKNAERKLGDALFKIEQGHRALDEAGAPKTERLGVSRMPLNIFGRVYALRRTSLIDVIARVEAAEKQLAEAQSRIDELEAELQRVRKRLRVCDEKIMLERTGRSDDRNCD